MREARVRHELDGRGAMDVKVDRKAKLLGGL